MRNDLLWKAVVVRRVDRGGTCHWCNADAKFKVERCRGVDHQWLVNSACTNHAEEWRKIAVTNATFDKEHISKLVGWDAASAPIPNVREIKIMAERARAGSEHAAARLLFWYRFSLSPRTDADTEAINVLTENILKILV